MSCTAINSLTGEVLVIPPSQNAKDIWPAEVLSAMVSPISGQPVISVRPTLSEFDGQSPLRRSHWRLLRGTNPWPDTIVFDCEYGTQSPSGLRQEGGESIEHHLGKLLVQAQLQQELAGKEGFTVALEYKIPIARTKQYRIADVCVLDNGVPVEVHEIQFSLIPPQEIAERTADYEAHGLVTPKWYLGPKLSGSQGIIQALSEFTEDYVFIEVERKSSFSKAADAVLSAFS
jgi:hypothetical protein